MNQNQPNTLPPTYFEQVYQANADPWQFETSPYEREKYATTLAALPRPSYAHAFEVGCSLGVLTEKLAARCAQLLSIDVALEPLARAKARCANLPQVTFQQMFLPQEFPAQHNFDLVLLSEVGYYWNLADLGRVADGLLARMVPGAHLLLVHWTPVVHDYPLTGDEVHEFFLNRATPEGPLQHLHGERYEQYRLDLLEKR
ncbi:class I SAM-dependent DNA methyltransferase [Hymenobacter sp. GOD-10R]|uniref:class I SAM-dependent DNA methyltransferase n=1 Tax=Hymenobacter sp. GOD-10R TaxID=3093922 RepID=UPI002D7932D1|nr:SAM-dependent methyltransferase [Hymenobacter sp. GOD-10R]WRQ30758.1 SAM-dependent methyltransferase [Hymenobacter sp. GOD-10R]